MTELVIRGQEVQAQLGELFNLLSEDSNWKNKVKD